MAPLITITVYHSLIPTNGFHLPDKSNEGKQEHIGNIRNDYMSPNTMTKHHKKIKRDNLIHQLQPLQIRTVLHSTNKQTSRAYHPDIPGRGFAQHIPNYVGSQQQHYHHQHQGVPILSPQSPRTINTTPVPNISYRVFLPDMEKNPIFPDFRYLSANPDFSGHPIPLGFPGQPIRAEISSNSIDEIISDLPPRPGSAALLANIRDGFVPSGFTIISRPSGDQVSGILSDVNHLERPRRSDKHTYIVPAWQDNDINHMPIYPYNIHNSIRFLPELSSNEQYGYA